MFELGPRPPDLDGLLAGSSSSPVSVSFSLTRPRALVLPLLLPSSPPCDTLCAMSRRSAHLDFSIRGDELEQQRVQLEHNLQHTDLSLHLSSTPDEHSDVEYPRHASVPSPPFSAFASFDHHSGEDYDPHEQSRFHAWSYHTDDGIQPYAAESLSTAAHHASALTISAGLGGGRGARRDLSLSGAEYDPERPLQGIMAGIAGRVKGFDANSTKSRQIVSSFTTSLHPNRVHSINFTDSKRRRLRSPRRRQYCRARPCPPIRARITPRNTLYPFHILLVQLRRHRTHLSSTATRLTATSCGRSQSLNLFAKAASKCTRVRVAPCSQRYHPEFHSGSLSCRPTSSLIHPTATAPDEPIPFLCPTQR